MKLYVCYDFLKNIRTTGRPGGHPCGNAYRALKDAGYTPEVESVHGLGLPPFDRTDGRRRVKQLTGSSWVPVLVRDNGDVITDSKQVVAWAAENPAA